MKETTLKSIRGKKIRRQYFNFPLIILFSAMIFASYGISVISIGMGKSEQYIWHDNFLTSFWVCLGFSLPFLLLRVINKNFFGRIICVLTEEGIHYPRGMLRWETIEKIEYAIDSKPRYKSDPAKSFRAIIYTRGGKHVVLESAPMCIISRAKKYKRELDVKIAGVTSLFPTVLVMTVILALIPIWIILMARAPGASTAQLVTVFVSYIALSFIKLPIFDYYSVEYRFGTGSCRINGCPMQSLGFIILLFSRGSLFCTIFPTG